MYLVSILVPVFKVERFIERCARSLFGQSYQNLEFVFVDDCSPDGSIGVLQRVLNDYPGRSNSVKIVHHDRNRGLAASRNTALDNATGLFVCAVDSDDWLEFDGIEKLVNKQVESSADIVACNMMMHTKDGDQPFFETKCTNKEELVLLQLQKTWDHTVCRKLIRRALYEDNGIRCIEGCDMTEDRYQMALLTYYAESYAQIDDIVYHYERRNENSIMAQKETDQVLRKNFQYLMNWRGIKDFFSDKESVYYTEATKQTVMFAKRFFSQTVIRNSKEWYRRLTFYLDREDNEFQLAYGWPTTGIKGAFKHCFFLVEMVYKARVVFESAQKTIYRVFRKI